MYLVLMFKVKIGFVLYLFSWCCKFNNKVLNLYIVFYINIYSWLMGENVFYMLGKIIICKVFLYKLVIIIIFYIIGKFKIKILDFK